MPYSDGAKALLTLVPLLVGLEAAALRAQEQTYPPITEYLMDREAEVALARSAAPERISADATVKVLTTSGYEVAAEGDNGFVCIVQRGWAAATAATAEDRDLAYYSRLRAPICFDSIASRTVLPVQELQARLGLEGKRPEQISEEVQAAYASGELPEMEPVAFAYMFSADQDLGPGFGAWHPHMMVYTPGYENATLGGNEPDSGLPLVGDGGTKFAVTVIPVDDGLAVAAAGGGQREADAPR